MRLLLIVDIPWRQGCLQKDKKEKNLKRSNRNSNCLSLLTKRAKKTYYFLLNVYFCLVAFINKRLNLVNKSYTYFLLN